jgi:predicted nucleic acid-binding protein
VVSALARVEVPAALWRKQRIGGLDPTDARILNDEFEDDFYGYGTTPPRFAALDVSTVVLEDATRLAAAHGLRAYDAVQLASALAARAADPGCDAFACFDAELRDAAAAAGLALVPPRLD